MALRENAVIPRMEYARRLLGLSQQDSWYEYKLVGGTISGGNYERWHRGSTPPPADQYEIIAKMYDSKLKGFRGAKGYRVFGESYWVDALTGEASSNFSYMETASDLERRVPA